MLILGLIPGICSAQQQTLIKAHNELMEEVERGVSELKQELERGEYFSDYEQNLTISFKIDTFRIERLFAKRLCVDYTTVGMVQATIELEAGYDMLLNKYYRILKGKLDMEDQELLLQSQRNWIKFRDSERIFNSEISKDKYSGGGTIQRLHVASRYQLITKERLLEIYHYLTRFTE